MNQRTRTERRLNPLTGDWILVSRGRTNRPWTGQVEFVDENIPVTFDPDCALCPGTRRASGETNTDYVGTYVFENDFPALSAVSDPQGTGEQCSLFKAENEQGVCRVVCFSENHGQTLAQMETAQIADVVDVWAEQTSELMSRPEISHVQIFENRGETMGCSNPHPHGQIWAQGHIPTLPAKELAAMNDYGNSHGRSLLSDYIDEELTRGERAVCENESFVVLVPYWAAWPFETLVVPKRCVGLLTEFTEVERAEFADIIHRLSVRYDNLFQTSFPYSSGIHQRPKGADRNRWFHLHMHYFPPLLRSASVRKFMVGYEMMAEAQRDLSPEKAAALLRDQSEAHYRHSGE